VVPDTSKAGFDLRNSPPAAAGNQVLLTNRDTNVWQFQFDAANRLTNTITPLLRTLSQTWNHQGLVSTVTDPAHQTTYLYYNGRNQLTNRTDDTGTTLYGFDGNNNRTSASENGLANTWTYDAYNRISTYRDAYGNLIQYRYDNDGNLTNLVYPGDKNVYYFYDSNDHLTNVTDWTNRQTTLMYDLDGRLKEIIRPNGTTRTLNYDSAGELTNVWEQMPNGMPIVWCRFNWNSNSTMHWEFAAPLPHTNSPPTRDMSYNADNELAMVDGLNVTNDLNGNLTYGPLTNDDFVNLAFDARNRLLNAGGVTNIYDAMNIRIGQTYGTNSVEYVVNPNAKLPQVLMSIKNGVTNYYVYGAGLLYQVTETPTGEKTLTYHYDYRGSTVALTDDSGNVVDRFEYSLYGTLTYRSGADDTPFLFNGRYGVMSDPNGLLYMRARYYNPYICRFINPDPSGFAGGLNWYVYANGNPVSYEDPMGLQGIPSPANIAMGMANYDWPVVSDAQWNQQFQAANQQALPIEVSALGGYAVGAAGATAVGVGATTLVSAGVPQSVVTGGLFVTGVAGVTASGYSIYNNPSPNNIAFNAGGLAGGLAVGGFLANNVASALSPSGYQPSDPASLASELSMVWRDNSGNPNPLSMLPAWLLPGAEVGPMSTGPSTGGAAGAIGGAGFGVAGGFSLWAGQGSVDWLGNPVSSSSTGKH
jgi:RHS repeat-associated protein